MSQTFRILIVDDERVVGYTLAKALHYASRGEFEVEVRHSPQQALTLAEQKPFDLVITDLRMSEMSGLVLIHRLRRAAPQTRTILMTGFGSAEVEAEALKMGDAYLTKPFNLNEVMTLVRQTLQQTQTQAIHVATPYQALNETLEKLRRDITAPYVMLLEMNGNTLVDVGDPSVVEQRALNALLSNSMAAANELAHALNEKGAFDLHYHGGENYEIYSAKVDDSTFVSTVFKHQSTRIGQIWLSLKRTVEQLREQLAALPAPEANPEHGLGEFELDLALDDSLFAEMPSPPTPTPTPSASPNPAQRSLSLEEALQRGVLSHPNSKPSSG